MTSLYDWFRTVAFALNDDEPGAPFQRYPLKDMIAAYNAAMCLVARYRSDLFTELRTIRLAPGKYQDVRGCCSNVLDVLDQVDANGTIVKELGGSRNTRTTVKRLWKKPSCITPTLPGQYRVDNAQVDPNLHGRFTVEPAVPCGVDAWVIVKCVTSPCEFSEADANQIITVDCVYNVAAWHYVLATMMTGDRFDNAAGGDRAYHYRMFFDILGIVQRQDDRLESMEQA